MCIHFAIISQNVSIHFFIFFQMLGVIVITIINSDQKVFFL